MIDNFSSREPDPITKRDWCLLLGVIAIAGLLFCTEARAQTVRGDTMTIDGEMGMTPGWLSSAMAGAQDPNVRRVVLDSPGGNALPVYAVCAFLANRRPDVTVYVKRAHSAAGWCALITHAVLLPDAVMSIEPPVKNGKVSIPEFQLLAAGARLSPEEAAQIAALGSRQFLPLYGRSAIWAGQGFVNSSGWLSKHGVRTSDRPVVSASK